MERKVNDFPLVDLGTDFLINSEFVLDNCGTSDVRSGNDGMSEVNDFIRVNASPEIN